MKLIGGRAIGFDKFCPLGHVSSPLDPCRTHTSFPSKLI